MHLVLKPEEYFNIKAKSILFLLGNPERLSFQSNLSDFWDFISEQSLNYLNH